MRIFKALSLALLIASLFSSLSLAAQQDRISGSLSNGESHVLKGNIRHQALPDYDQGRVDPGMQLGTITLLTAPTVAQESAIKLLLAQQQDRKSPNYHKWLTPEQYADRFGLSENDIQKIVAWLAAQGFTMIEPAHGRNFITFTGTAAQVENAFGTEIHHYNVKGELHYANATAPQIPAGLAGIVVGMHGLDNFHLKAMNVKRARPNYYSSARQAQYFAPGDIYTMYDLNPLLNATPKIDGTGQKIGIVGETEIYQSDINDFRTNFGLSAISCTAGAIPNDIITACSDPHFSYISANGGPDGVDANTLPESDLDLEWSGAVAPGAQIVFVTSSDVYDSLYYAIDNTVAPVISMSFGDCEFYLNITDVAYAPDSILWETELQTASAAGITVVNSAGDSGAAECDDNILASNPNGTLTATGQATFGLAVSYPASSQYVTGVGGTAIPLADIGSSTYWGTTNGTNGGSLLSTAQIPEQAWNDDDEFATYCAQGSNTFCSTGAGNEAVAPPWVAITSEATAQRDIGIGSGGGGASNCYQQTSDLSACVSGFPQPAWQTVTVSGQTTRMSPDISLLASADFPGFIYCTQLSALTGSGTGSTCATGIPNAISDNSLVGGTSVSAPMFAGMVALINQYRAENGSAGETGPVPPINQMLYQTAATAPSAFHDITAGDNNVACEPGTYAGNPTAILCPSTGVIGYTASAGFDMATGLGSVDVNKLAVALANPPSFSISASPTSLSVYAGQTGTATITVTPVNNFSNPVSFSCNGLPTGSTCSFSPTSVTPSGAAVTTTATVTAGSGATSGSIPITVYGTTGNSSATASTFSQPSPSIALTVTSALTSFTPTAASFPVTQGNSVNVTAVLTLASGFTGTVSFTCTDPAPESICTVPTPVNASGQVSFNISTTAPTASLRAPGGTRIFYAVLLPGLFGLMLTAGTRRRSLRSMRFLGLILVMGFSTMWLASCGGSSGGNHNQGTPVGPYTFTVGATSGGATITSPSFTVNVSQ